MRAFCPISGKDQESLSVCLVFTVEDKPGSLNAALDQFHKHSICLHHIESRPSKANEEQYDFYAEFNVLDIKQVQDLLASLRPVTKSFEVISSNPELRFHQVVDAVPWFPRRISDLDQFANKVLECGEELSSDHPGFTDLEYRKRRTEITALARTYRTGQPIPEIEYTDQEKATWKAVYTKVRTLHPTCACRELNYIFPLLELNCGFSPDNIPQLDQVSKFLHDCTGFRLKPVTGLLTARDFLNGLAFRVFHSTQYIRHHSQPYYTPEPDICHEMLGHVPLLADHDFAAFSQEIGLCSIAASDADIEKLATIYWFTVEFGLCKQDGKVRAYGAGLLSSYGELEYCLTDKPTTASFDPTQASNKSYPITEYQPHYFIAESFTTAQAKVRDFATTQMERPFSVRYDPYTQSVEVLDSRARLWKYAQGIQREMQTLADALGKLQTMPLRSDTMSSKQV